MSIINVSWLDPNDTNSFPDPESALDDPEGLVAAGGDLSVDRLTYAYNNGIFPWYQDDQPILWWSPNPRGVIYPQQYIAHNSVLRTLKREQWQITIDQSFKQVMLACAEPRSYSKSTWITDEMLTAYCQLHALGHAHSIEVWSRDKQLVGGIYGLSIGQIFSGESMFSRADDGSKIALMYLCAYLDTWNYTLIDTQLPSKHLSSLGGISLSRKEYLDHLATAKLSEPDDDAWNNESTINIYNWLSAQKISASDK